MNIKILKPFRLILVVILFSGFLLPYQVFCLDSPELNPLRTVAELNLQESMLIILNNGEAVEVKLLEINEVHDRHRGALRSATVRIAVDGEEVSLGVGNYHLPVTLDGSRSRSLQGDIREYKWSFSDGSRAEGPVQKRTYDKPGEYSEVLKAVDSAGNIDYDFTVVQVYDREHPGQPIPTIHASYYPTLDISAGEPVTFIVRIFTPEAGQGIWDFGDRTPPVTIQTEGVTDGNRIDGEYAMTRHAFARPGQYIVRVQGTNEHGLTATTHLKVVVGE